MTFLKYTPTIATIALLAGCATTPTVDPTPDPDPTPEGFTQADADAFMEARDEYSANLTPADQIPATGTATYSGAIAIMNSSDYDNFESADYTDYAQSAVLGQLTLNLDFEADTVEGEATDFVEATFHAYEEWDGSSWNDSEALLVSGDAVSGTLTADGIIESGQWLSGYLYGDLTNTDGDVSSYDLFLTANIETTDTAADTLGITFEGDITTSAGLGDGWGSGILSEE